MGLSLIGKFGKVVKDVNDDDNTGQIRIRNTTTNYRARAQEEDNIPVGTFVKVLDSQGITLIIKRVDKDDIPVDSSTGEESNKSTQEKTSLNQRKDTGGKK